MYVLALDTSTLTGSLALFKNQNLVSYHEWSREGSHSEFLTHYFEVILNKNKISAQDIARIAVGIGPGSFTGIRVGINFARALSYSLNIPVYPLNSLHLLASQNLSSDIQSVVVAQYAFRNLVYFAEYRLDQSTKNADVTKKNSQRTHEVTSPVAWTIDQFCKNISAPALALGSAFTVLKDQIPANKLLLFKRSEQFYDLPSAKDFINTPALDQSPNQLTDWIHTIPLYIRASEAEEKLKNATNSIL